MVEALDIAAFGSVEEFKRDMDTYSTPWNRRPPRPAWSASA
jgi:hypothetical protein